MLCPSQSSWLDCSTLLGLIFVVVYTLSIFFCWKMCGRVFGELQYTAVWIMLKVSYLQVRSLHNTEREQSCRRYSWWDLALLGTVTALKSGEHYTDCYVFSPGFLLKPQPLFL
jgi:hypothetical protein